MLRSNRNLVAFLPAALVLLAVGGCAVKHPTTNVVHGKVLFVSKCGVCHTLSHASTTGSIGPNLDDAFRQDRADGIKSTSIQGLVSYWIQYPNGDKFSGAVMPAMLYKGQDAEDVAAYVAGVAAKPGQDTGALAAAVQAQVPNTAAAGKAVFTGVGGCGSCHTLAAAGTSGTVGPNLDKDLRINCATPQSKKVRGVTLPQCIQTAIVKPYAYLPPGYAAGVMPNNFSQTLSPSQIKALVTFISSATK
ncbi:MAG TPA: c-type cytochrome [Solirubrobacteraceae bacterium]|jgi:mono/diheme cytochrome c family protein